MLKGFVLEYGVWELGFKLLAEMHGFNRNASTVVLQETLSGEVVSWVFRLGARA